MRKRVLVFFGFVIVSSVVAVTFWIQDSEPVNAQSVPQNAHPLSAINEKAKLARNGEVSAAEEYVGEIIRVTGFDSELRGFTASTIADRVGRAESRYRQGLTSGVQESRIVRTVNGLVQKFALPNFAKTDAYEVRQLRLSLFVNFAQVMNQRNQGTQPTSAGSQLSSEMSPAEAVFVLGMMLQQKLANPENQQTYSERVANWAETHNHREVRSRSTGAREHRSREIRDVLRQAAATTTVTDALQLSNVTLNTLGIEQ